MLFLEKFTQIYKTLETFFSLKTFSAIDISDQKTTKVRTEKIFWVHLSECSLTFFFSQYPFRPTRKILENQNFSKFSEANETGTFHRNELKEFWQNIDHSPNEPTLALCSISIPPVQYIPFSRSHFIINFNVFKRAIDLN